MGCLKLTYYPESSPLKVVKDFSFSTEKSDAGAYRYGFNGKEKTDEIEGTGNSYDFGARMYDPRLGKWLSLDPLQMKYPGLSPYHAMADNPILIVDQDGKENIVYLVVATDKSGKPSIGKVTAQNIVAETNEIYKGLGLQTRVVLYEGSEPFNPAYTDKTDVVAVIGKTKQQATDYIKKNISGEFGKVLEEDKFPSSDNNPETSENPGRKGGSIVVVGYDAIKKFYMWDTGATEEEEAAFTVAHGTGHNATEVHDSGIMSDANKLLWNKPKLKDLTKKGVSNKDYTNSMKKRFGDKTATDNYNKNKKAKTTK